MNEDFPEPRTAVSWVGGAVQDHSTKQQAQITEFTGLFISVDDHWYSTLYTHIMYIVHVICITLSTIFQVSAAQHDH